MTNKYISVSAIKKKKCPLSRQQCLAPDCCLWRGGMDQIEHIPGRGHVRSEAGICQLAFRGGRNG